MFCYIDFHIFLYILNTKIYCSYRLHALCVRARNLHGLERRKYRALMFCFNDFCIYLHICSLFNKRFAIQSKIALTAISTQFILYSLLNGQTQLSGQFSKSPGGRAVNAEFKLTLVGWFKPLSLWMKPSGIIHLKVFNKEMPFFFL